MEISLSGLVLLAIFAFYLWNEHNNKVLKLERDRFEKEQEIKRLLESQSNSKPEVIHKIETIHEPKFIFIQQQPSHKRIPKPQYFLPSPNTFVKVIFNKYDRKCYDYFLGDNYDVQVGDFVDVYAHDKFNHNILTRKVVQIVYISKPGEISKKANSKILCKAVNPAWY